MCQRSLPEGQKNFHANIAPVVDSGRLFRSFTMQPFHFYESSRFFSPLLPIWRWYWDQSWVAVEFFIIDFHIFFLPFISPCQHSVNPFRRHFFLSISILFLKIYNVFIFFYGHFSLALLALNFVVLVRPEFELFCRPRLFVWFTNSKF